MTAIDVRDQYALDNWAVTDAVFVLGLYSFVLELKTGNETLYIHYIEGIITEIKIDYQSHVEIVNWTGRSASGLRNIFLDCHILARPSSVSIIKRILMF